MMGDGVHKTGLPYELLVREIFQAIHNQEQVANIVVEHDKSLLGRTLTLGWFILEPEIRSFKVPSEKPEEGTVEELSMGLKATIFEPLYSNFAIQIDSVWLANNPATAEIDKSSLKLGPLPVLEVTLYDQNQSSVGNLEGIVRQEIAAMHAEKLNQKHVEHTFDAATFLGPESTGNFFVKINKVAFDLDVAVTHRPAHFNLSRFVKLVLREIPSKKEQTFLARKQKSHACTSRKIW